MKVYQELERKKHRQMYNLDSAYNEFISNKLQSMAIKNSPGLISSDSKENPFF